MEEYHITESGYPYFLTSSIVKWLPVFVSESTCDIIIDSLRYCRENRGLKIHAYTIMPTHIHIIISAEADLSAILRDFKKFTSKQIIAVYAKTNNPPFDNVFKFCGRDNHPPTEHKVWQDGNHPELIKTRDFCNEKVDYIHANPFRKGLVIDPMSWKYSSIRYYHGVGDGPLEVDWLDL